VRRSLQQSPRLVISTGKLLSSANNSKLLAGIYHSGNLLRRLQFVLNATLNAFLVLCEKIRPHRAITSPTTPTFGKHSVEHATVDQLE